MFSTDHSAAGADAVVLRRRDLVVILLALLGVTAIAWLYLLTVAQGMSDAMDMPDMAMPMTTPETPAAFGLTFAMWWVMMLGMMAPSAAPMVQMFATISRSKRARGQDFVPVSIFLLGYLIVWGAFSVAASLVQWGLNDIALLSLALAVTSPVLAGRWPSWPGCTSSAR